jgi:hypothetical protein
LGSTVPCRRADELVIDEVSPVETAGEAAAIARDAESADATTNAKAASVRDLLPNRLGVPALRSVIPCLRSPFSTAQPMITKYSIPLAGVKLR